MDYEEVRRTIFQPPNFVLIVGDPGAGKTFLTQMEAYRQSKQGALVISNVLYQQYYQKNGEWRTREIEPPGIKTVFTLSDAFYQMAKAREKDFHRPIILILDEFATYLDKNRYYEDMTKDFISMMPLRRKLNMCLVGLTVLSDSIPKEFKSRRSGFLDYRLKKDILLVNKIIDGETRRSALVDDVFKKVMADIDKEMDKDAAVMEICRKTAFLDDFRRGISNIPLYIPSEFPWKPLSDIPWDASNTDVTPTDGQIEYDTWSAGAMDPGERRDGTPFELGTMLKLISRKLSKEVPGTILSYIEGDGEQTAIGKLSDDVFFDELIRRSKGRISVKKGEKYNFRDLREDVGPDQAYKLMRKAKERYGFT